MDTEAVEQLGGIHMERGASLRVFLRRFNVPSQRIAQESVGLGVVAGV